jgi:pimeloyl-ACP methyl ester carboxylesterase
MNGLQGRMLHMPAPKRYAGREFLVIYGHHALLERWWGLALNFNDYGAVTMPDLPGFGGMDSFYRIGKKPTIDNFADYLAAFIKLRYKRKRVMVVGISFGFVVITRMLQRYPELAKNVDVVVSMVGFMHRDDFLFKPFNRKLYSAATKVCATRPVAFVIRYGWLNGFTIRTLYRCLPLGRRRFADMQPSEFRVMIDFDVYLWQANDVRTHWATTSEFLQIDNCTRPINLPVWHIASMNDYYFNNQIVKEHMLVVFNSYTEAYFNSKAHTPGIMSDKKELGIMLPKSIRKLLSQAP